MDDVRHGSGSLSHLNDLADIQSCRINTVLPCCDHVVSNIHFLETGDVMHLQQIVLAESLDRAQRTGLPKLANNGTRRRSLFRDQHDLSGPRPDTDYASHNAAWCDDRHIK